jgi:hypothetical protein
MDPNLNNHQTEDCREKEGLYSALQTVEKEVKEPSVGFSFSLFITTRNVTYWRIINVVCNVAVTTT